ncbi:hypothetical protein Taro_024132, partial [Colocasia esculenta]|nr:hypothetical protein [Colocasia esculenta]
ANARGGARWTVGGVYKRWVAEIVTVAVVPESPELPGGVAGAVTSEKCLQDGWSLHSRGAGCRRWGRQRSPPRTSRMPSGTVETATDICTAVVALQLDFGRNSVEFTPLEKAQQPSRWSSATLAVGAGDSDCGSPAVGGCGREPPMACTATAQIGQCVTLTKVMKIETEYNWFYNSCNKCRRKVKPDGGKFWYDKCSFFVKFVVPRYKVQLRVIDHTGSASFLLFDQEANQILNKTAINLRDKLIKESNENLELDESIKQGEQITDVDT